MKVVLLAGGYGTRMKELFPTLPKPMIPIAGKPVLQHQIEWLRDQGYTDLLITVHYRARTIQSYFQDGSRFGVHIEYFYEKEALGNAGALYYLKDQLQEDFFVINGDVLFYVDLDRMAAFHRDHQAIATILVHPNLHPQDSSIVMTDTDQSVLVWFLKHEPKPAWYANCVNAGIHILSPEVFDHPWLQDHWKRLLHFRETMDLDRQVFQALIDTNRFYAYKSSEYVKDMGTPARYNEVCKDVLSGRARRMCRDMPQKAIFLDRDGTINRDVGFLWAPEELELIDYVSDAISIFHRLGYLVVVATNQPVIARGEVTWQTLHEIHNKMETLMGAEGAYIDGIYVCPHHPHRGYPGEVPAYKIDCDCRKPKPGLLLQAASEMNIDLHQSWMVGDRSVDVECGRKAGTRTARILDQGIDQPDQGCWTSVYTFARWLEQEQYRAAVSVSPYW